MKRNKKIKRNKNYKPYYERQRFDYENEFISDLNNWDCLIRLEESELRLKPLDKIMDIFLDNIIYKREENRIKKRIVETNRNTLGMGFDIDDADIDIPFEKKEYAERYLMYHLQLQMRYIMWDGKE